ncbi:hypothetical protein FNV43_RR05589 [Rhamnella rubrinervis]|uniref:LRAT domain-containing protein n=1 Tax=Rhamnella rubrinervis TaxID=2594499 RepID=A0A8K0HMD3_9ROSA|nr:hypothetical protein FNV43_RR05589 [Rhamnella rubrinervis]
MGDGKVIHLTRGPGLIFSSSSKSRPSNDRIVCCNVEDFLCDGQLHRFEYGVSRVAFIVKRAGTCTRASSDPPEQVLYRASYLVEHGFGDYHLVDRNCEDFALYCKTGIIKGNESATGSSGQITSLFAAIIALTVIPYRFVPFGAIGLALVVYGMYCSFRLSLDVGSKGSHFSVVAVEKLDNVQPEDKKEEKNTSWYMTPGYYATYTIWVINYWYWTSESTILIYLKSVYLYFILYCFVENHLRKFRNRFKLGKYSAYTIWVLGYLYWRWQSVSTILLWTRLFFLCCCLDDIIPNQENHPGRWKLKQFNSNTIWVLHLWHWTPGSKILQWIKLALLDMFLFNYIPSYLAKHRLMRGAFFACFVIQSAVLLLELDYNDYISRITDITFL